VGSSPISGSEAGETRLFLFSSLPEDVDSGACTSWLLTNPIYPSNYSIGTIVHIVQVAYLCPEFDF
jgi:hypothetical protein